MAHRPGNETKNETKKVVSSVVSFRALGGLICKTTTIHNLIPARAIPRYAIAPSCLRLPSPTSLMPSTPFFLVAVPSFEYSITLTCLFLAPFVRCYGVRSPLHMYHSRSLTAHDVSSSTIFLATFIAYFFILGNKKPYDKAENFLVTNSPTIYLSARSTIHGQLS